MKKCLIWILLLLTVLGLVGCGEEVSVAPELLAPVGVKTTTAKVCFDSIYTIETYDAQVVPYVEELSFCMDGKLDEVLFMLGDYVTEGQVLATLQEDDLLEQINTLKDEIYSVSKLGEYEDRQTSADIEIAKVKLEKMRAEGATAQDCSLQELEIRKLELRLEQAKEQRQLEINFKWKNLTELQEKLENNQIVAPFTGRIAYASPLRPGDSIKAYSTVIGIADESKLTLKSDFIKENIFENADKVYAKIADKEYNITYLPYDRAEYTSLILSGGQVCSQFTVDAKDGELESGQFGVIVIMQDYKEKTLTIPVHALYRDDNGRHVYKIVNGKRERCDVTTGMITDTKVEILEGLTEGDEVYVSE